MRKSKTYVNIHDSISVDKEDFPDGSVVKNPPASIGDVGLIPGSGRFPGEGNDNPLQYSCLGNPLDRGAWWATVQGVTKNRTRLKDCAHSNADKGRQVHKNPAQRVAGRKRDRP